MAPILPLPAELTIYTVGELHPQWLAWLAADDDEEMQIDAAAVTDVDAAGVQLVLSLRRSLHDARRVLRITAASDTFAAACRALGVGDLLPVPA